MDVFEGSLSLEEIMSTDISLLDALFNAKSKLNEEKNKIMEKRQREAEQNAQDNTIGTVTNTGKRVK